MTAKEKWYSVTIDYHHAKGHGSWLGSSKGVDGKDAIKNAVRDLRNQGMTDLRIGPTQAKLSGWQRGRP